MAAASLSGATRRLGSLLLIAVLAACAGEPCAGQAGLKAELLFGRNVAGRAPVSEAEWAAFLADTVTPRFPDGLTVIDGRGQWLDPATRRIEREDAKLVLIAVPAGPDTIRRLDEIADTYKRRFDQQSVGRLLTPACMAF